MAKTIEVAAEQNAAATAVAELQSMKDAMEETASEQMTDEQIAAELDAMESDGKKQDEQDTDAVVLFADLNADMLAVLTKLDIVESRNDIMLSAFYSVIRGKVTAKLTKSKTAYWEVSRRKKPELILAAEQRVKDWMELLTTIEKVPEL